MAWISYQFIRVAAALIGAGLIVIGAIFTYEPLMIGVIMVLATAYSVYAKRYPDAPLRIAVSRRWRPYMALLVILCYCAQVVLLDFFLDEADRWNWSWIAFDIIVLIGMLITLVQNYSLSERLAATDPGGQTPEVMREIVSHGYGRSGRTPSGGGQSTPTAASARAGRSSGAQRATPARPSAEAANATGTVQSPTATGAAATTTGGAVVAAAADGVEQRRYPPGLWTAAGLPALYVREMTVMVWMVAYLTLILAKLVFIYINSRPSIDDFWGNDTCVLFLGIMIPIVIGYRFLLEPPIRSYSMKILFLYIDCFVFATDMTDALSFWRLSQLGLAEGKFSDGIGGVNVAFVCLAIVASVFLFLYPFLYSRNEGLETIVGRKRRPAPWILIFRYGGVICVDIPLIVLRFVVWIRFDTAISAFILKNAFCILLFRGIWSGPTAMQLFHRHHNVCPCTDPTQATEIVVPVRRSQKETDQTIAALTARVEELEGKVGLRERQLHDHKRVLEQFNVEMDRMMEEVAAKDRMLLQAFCSHPSPPLPHLPQYVQSPILPSHQSTNDQQMKATQQFQMPMQPLHMEMKPPSAARSLYADLMLSYPTVTDPTMMQSYIPTSMAPPMDPQQLQPASATDRLPAPVPFTDLTAGVAAPAPAGDQQQQGVPQATPTSLLQAPASAYAFAGRGAMSRANTPAGFVPPIVDPAAMAPPPHPSMLPRGMVSSPAVY